jgi:hypothetical protein
MNVFGIRRKIPKAPRVPDGKTMRKTKASSAWVGARAPKLSGAGALGKGTFSLNRQRDVTITSPAPARAVEMKSASSPLTRDVRRFPAAGISSLLATMPRPALRPADRLGFPGLPTAQQIFSEVPFTARLQPALSVHS